MSEARSEPRILRRIVFGYAIDCFPSQLILGHNQLKRKLERAGFAVSVSFRPLGDLPANVDLLIVAPELEQEAQRNPCSATVLVVDNFVNHPAYDQLIEELRAGKEWTAARLADRPTTMEEGKILSYRGYEQIE